VERDTRLRQGQQVGSEFRFEVAAKHGVTVFRCSNVQGHPVVPHVRHTDRLDRDQWYLALQRHLPVTIFGYRNHEMYCLFGLRGM